MLSLLPGQKSMSVNSFHPRQAPLLAAWRFAVSALLVQPASTHLHSGNHPDAASELTNAPSFVRLHNMLYSVMRILRYIAIRGPASTAFGPLKAPFLVVRIMGETQYLVVAVAERFFAAAASIRTATTRTTTVRCLGGSQIGPQFTVAASGLSCFRWMLRQRTCLPTWSLLPTLCTCSAMNPWASTSSTRSETGTSFTQVLIELPRA